MPNQPPLNPDALEDASNAVRRIALGEVNSWDVAEAAIKAYLAVAQPEALPDDVERVAAALHGDNCPDYPEPGESCDCDWSSFQRMAEVAIEAMQSVAQPVVNSVEELDALPLGTIIEDSDDDCVLQALERGSIMGTEWYIPGVEKIFTSKDVELPARVLYRPEVKP